MRLAVSALLVSIVVAGCAKKPAAPPPAPVLSDVPVRGDQTSASVERSDEDAAREERERAERERRAREAAARLETTRTLEAAVHFAYDRSDLSQHAREILEAKAVALQANPDIRIRIVGHTDERGSDEYNLALGQRRAAAANRYLVQRGVDPARIEFVSMGETRPRCSDPVESCWMENRRAEFEIR